MSTRYAHNRDGLRRINLVDNVARFAKTLPVQGGWRVVYRGKSLGVAPDRLYSSIRLVCAQAVRFGKVS